MLNLSFCAIISALLLTFLRQSDPFFYALFYIVTEVSFIFLLMYLVSILQYMYEALSIQNPFSILLGLQIVKIVCELFFPIKGGSLITGISMINIIILLYALTASFKIRSREIAWPFRILTISWLLALTAKALLLIGIFGKPRIANFSLYALLINVIPFIAIYYLIRQTGKVLNEKVTINEADQTTLK